MKAVIQRVSRASVSVDGKCVGKIGQGYLILLGVTRDDTEEDAVLLSSKTAGLRVFCDENDKMNKSIIDIEGEALVVSNFTLCADTKKGTRPSFMGAMPGDEADRLYGIYCDELLKCAVKKVDRGVFGADMEVEMSGDGPVTIILDTEIWRKRC